MSGSGESGYKRAGVDLDAAARSLDLITHAVESTYTPGVISGPGSFGGLFAVPDGYASPVLVASTDGVGTKVMVASALADQPGVLEGIGRDLVNHCVNDILVQGARPLFFLDYVASSALDPETVARVVSGVATACRAAGAALLGGETAEMPGVYRQGEFDLVGTVVGIVDRADVVDGRDVVPGDAILALPSGGLQTNGFSLARSVLAGSYHEALPSGQTVGAALLAEHRSFLDVVWPLLAGSDVKAMAHITGGGLPGNLLRGVPRGLGADIRRGSWHEPEVFGLIETRGAITTDEMFRVFNMGVGFALVTAHGAAERLVEASEGSLVRIGTITDGGGVRIA